MMKRRTFIQAALGILAAPKAMAVTDDEVMDGIALTDTEAAEEWPVDERVFLDEAEKIYGGARGGGKSELVRDLLPDGSTVVSSVKGNRLLTPDEMAMRCKEIIDHEIKMNREIVAESPFNWYKGSDTIKY